MDTVEMDGYVMEKGFYDKVDCYLKCKLCGRVQHERVYSGWLNQMPHLSGRFKCEACTHEQEYNIHP